MIKLLNKLPVIVLKRLGPIELIDEKENYKRTKQETRSGSEETRAL